MILYDVVVLRLDFMSGYADFTCVLNNIIF